MLATRWLCSSKFHLLIVMGSHYRIPTYPTVLLWIFYHEFVFMCSIKTISKPWVRAIRSSNRFAPTGGTLTVKNKTSFCVCQSRLKKLSVPNRARFHHCNNTSLEFRSEVSPKTNPTWEKRPFCGRSKILLRPQCLTI